MLSAPYESTIQREVYYKVQGYKLGDIKGERGKAQKLGDTGKESAKRFAFSSTRSTSRSSHSSDQPLGTLHVYPTWTLPSTIASRGPATWSPSLDSIPPRSRRSALQRSSTSDSAPSGRLSGLGCPCYRRRRRGGPWYVRVLGGIRDSPLRMKPTRSERKREPRRPDRAECTR